MHHLNSAKNSKNTVQFTSNKKTRNRRMSIAKFKSLRKAKYFSEWTKIMMKWRYFWLFFLAITGSNSKMRLSFNVLNSIIIKFSCTLYRSLSQAHFSQNPKSHVLVVASLTYLLSVVFFVVVKYCNKTNSFQTTWVAL